PKDKTEIAKFASLFNDFNSYLEAAKIQGFKWSKKVYKSLEGISEKIDIVELLISENQYLTLVQRYKELLSDSISNSSGGDAIPYDIKGYIVEIDTQKIDTDYMNSRFTKYIKELQNGSSGAIANALDELHKSFAILSQEDQKYANIFLHDIQSGNVYVDDNKTLYDYINEYKCKAKDDQIHRFANAFGINEEKLRNMMGLKLTASNINEFGRFDELKKTIDKTKAKEYLERKEGVKLIPLKVNIKMDKLLREFILNGGFEL
ncbi:MAG: type I restriction endonuclease subunit R, EcoR124 family, partial [Thomasclavelia spiroformis]